LFSNNISSCSICCQGISKEYAFAYFPHASTVVTLQRPGNSKKWHPIFYKKNESRKNMLMGQWLNFVRENHVQEGDICLLEPGKSEERSIFMVYLLRTKSAHSRCRAGSHMEKPIDGIIAKYLEFRKLIAFYIIPFLWP
jgi:hypothetical protein